MKWNVVIFGKKCQPDFEISVVREDDTHGHESWGWFSDTKLLISHDDGCSGLTENVWDKMTKLANEVADELRTTNLNISDVSSNDTITLTKEELITFTNDVEQGIGSWSDTSYRICRFIGIDPTDGV